MTSDNPVKKQWQLLIHRCRVMQVCIKCMKQSHRKTGLFWLMKSDGGVIKGFNRISHDEEFRQKRLYVPFFNGVPSEGDFVILLGNNRMLAKVAGIRLYFQ